jgi:hypothetical protein
MKNTQEITGRVIDTIRQKSSRNGNPRYLVVYETVNGDALHFYTGVDSLLGYSITNRNWTRDVSRARVGMHRGRRTLDSIEPVRG